MLTSYFHLLSVLPSFHSHTGHATFFKGGSVATDLKGGDSLNSSFLHSWSFPILTVQKLWNWPTIAEVIVKIRALFFETWCIPILSYSLTELADSLVSSILCKAVSSMKWVPHLLNFELLKVGSVNTKPN